jgi:anti-sigma factor RsiW
MNDCQNAEMRDQLPDLLHERLAATERAVVMAHLDGCVDCRDELALLRVAHGTLIKATPRIDLNFIVEALPKTAPRTRTLSVSRRPMWSDWRIAAAAVVLVAGASSYSVLGRHSGVAIPDSLVARASLPTTSNPGTATQHAESAATPARTQQAETVIADLAPGATEMSGLGASRLGDLDEKQLKALLTEIDQLQATPITEPDPVTIRVDAKGSTTNPEGL